MAFVAVDLDGSEYIYDGMPFKDPDKWCGNIWILIPSGTIKKLIGRDLTFSEDPVELT